MYLNDESNSELVFLDKYGNTFFKIGNKMVYQKKIVSDSIFKTYFIDKN